MRTRHVMATIRTAEILRIQSAYAHPAAKSIGIERQGERSMPIADLGDIQLNHSSFGEGPPVVGIMGFSLDKTFWSPQVPAVTGAGRRFVTFDNRGIGKSKGPLISTVDEMANDTLRLMDELEIDKAVMFGVSMGGTIAQ